MIKIDDTWFIDTDPMQYIVKKKTMSKNKKTGEIVELFKSISFHSTIKHAIKSILDIELKEYINQNEISLTDAIKKISRLNEKTEALLLSINE